MYRFPLKLDELNLPDFHGVQKTPPVMSMDQYDRWIDEMSRDVVSREVREQALNRMPNPVPFKIF